MTNKSQILNLFFNINLTCFFKRRVFASLLVPVGFLVHCLVQFFFCPGFCSHFHSSCFTIPDVSCGNQILHFDLLLRIFQAVKRKIKSYNRLILHQYSIFYYINNIKDNYYYYYSCSFSHTFSIY